MVAGKESLELGLYDGYGTTYIMIYFIQFIINIEK
jgi:hypothetical protein